MSAVTRCPDGPEASRAALRLVRSRIDDADRAREVGLALGLLTPADPDRPDGPLVEACPFAPAPGSGPGTLDGPMALHGIGPG